MVAGAPRNLVTFLCTPPSQGCPAVQTPPHAATLPQNTPVAMPSLPIWSCPGLSCPVRQTPSPCWGFVTCSGLPPSPFHSGPDTPPQTTLPLLSPSTPPLPGPTSPGGSCSELNSSEKEGKGRKEGENEEEETEAKFLLEHKIHAKQRTDDRPEVQRMSAKRTLSASTVWRDYVLRDRSSCWVGSGRREVTNGGWRIGCANVQVRGRGEGEEVAGFKVYSAGRAHRICSWVKGGAWRKQDRPRILTCDLGKWRLPFAEMGKTQRQIKGSLSDTSERGGWAGPGAARQQFPGEVWLELWMWRSSVDRWHLGLWTGWNHPEVRVGGKEIYLRDRLALEHVRTSKGIGKVAWTPVASPAKRVNTSLWNHLGLSLYMLKTLMSNWHWPSRFLVPYKLAFHTFQGARLALCTSLPTFLISASRHTLKETCDPSSPLSMRTDL